MAPQHKCTTCGDKFRRHPDLLQHMRERHPGKMITSPKHLQFRLDGYDADFIRMAHCLSQSSMTDTAAPLNLVMGSKFKSVRNPFIKSLADQSAKWGLARPLRDDLFRNVVVTYMKTNQIPGGAINFIQPTGQSWIQYCNNMTMISTRIDANFIFASCKVLKEDILLVLSKTQTGNNVIKIKGDPGVHDTAIQLVIGYLGEQHYVSLESTIRNPATQEYMLDASINANAIVCSDPQAVTDALDDANNAVNNLTRNAAVQELEDVCKVANLPFSNRDPAKKSCIFHAIFDQMFIHNLPQKTTLASLHSDIVTSLRTNYGYQGTEDVFDYIKCTGVSCSSYDKESTNTFSVHVLYALANLLQRDIDILFTCTSSRGKYGVFLTVKGTNNPPADPLMIGYVNGLHFQSLELHGSTNAPSAPTPGPPQPGPPNPGPGTSSTAGQGVHIQASGVIRDPLLLDFLFTEIDGELLTQGPEESSHDRSVTYLKQNCRDLISFDLPQITPADINTNTFFTAISAQLIRCRKTPQQPQTLRTELVKYMKRNPTFLAPCGEIDMRKNVAGNWNTFCDQLNNAATPADATAVVAMARYLKHDILIITSSQDTSPGHSFVWIPGTPNCKDNPLVIGYLFNDYFASCLVPDFSNSDPRALNPCTWPKCPKKRFHNRAAYLRHMRNIHTGEFHPCRYYGPSEICTELTFCCLDDVEHHYDEDHPANDYDSASRAKLKQNCRILGLSIHGLTQPDGNCFFHAIEDQLDLNPTCPKLSFITLRSDLVDFLSKNSNIETEFGMVDLCNSLNAAIYPTWDDYIKCIKKDVAWADDIVIQAMATMLEVRIKVVTSSPGSFSIGNKKTEKGVDVNYFAKGNIQFPLLVVGHEFEKHYESLITGIQPQGPSTTGAGTGTTGQHATRTGTSGTGTTGPGTSGLGTGTTGATGTGTGTTGTTRTGTGTTGATGATGTGTGGSHSKQPKTPPSGTSGPDVICPICCGQYDIASINDHINTQHPGVFQQQP